MGLVKIISRSVLALFVVISGCSKKSEQKNQELTLQSGQTVLWTSDENLKSIGEAQRREKRVFDDLDAPTKLDTEQFLESIDTSGLAIKVKKDQDGNTSGSELLIPFKSQEFNPYDATDLKLGLKTSADGKSLISLPNELGYTATVECLNLKEICNMRQASVIRILRLRPLPLSPLVVSFFYAPSKASLLHEKDVNVSEGDRKILDEALGKTPRKIDITNIVNFLSGESYLRWELKEKNIFAFALLAPGAPLIWNGEISKEFGEWKTNLEVTDEQRQAHVWLNITKNTSSRRLRILLYEQSQKKEVIEQ